jgi:hypothetical protein
MTPKLTANDSASEHPVAAIISHALTILVALGAVGIPLLVPHFAAIFRDMLGDHPLPLATTLVLRFYPLLILLACSFAFAAIYFAWRFRTRSLPRLYSVGLLVAIMLQATFTTYALFLPLINIVHSLSSPP